MGTWLEKLNRFDIFILEFISIRTLNQYETNMKQIMIEMHNKGYKKRREYYYQEIHKMMELLLLIQYGTTPKYYIANKEIAAEIFNFASIYLKMEEICKKLSGTKRVK